MKTIKKIIFTALLCVSCSIGANAQTSYYIDTEERYICAVSADTVLIFAEKMPEFPGGRSALMEFFAENIIYPAEIIHTGWQGRILLQFVVRKTGEVTDISAFHEIFPPLDKEAVRVAKLMPDWIPGEHNGEKVNVKFILPLNLNLKPIIYDQAPQFPGGDEALLQYLLENIQFSFESDKRGTPQGLVMVQFNVSASGKISDIEIVSGVSPKLDAEVVRVVEAMPDWIPAERLGEKVDAPFQLPVNFQVVWLSEPSNYISDFFTVEKQPSDFIFPIVQRKAEFPGGIAALNRFLSNNIRFPADARRREVQGRVILQFTVDTDGKIADIEVIESIVVPLRRNTDDPLLINPNIDMVSIQRSMEREAVRVVERMPAWIPAEQLGRKVRTRFTLPIVFRLQ